MYSSFSKTTHRRFDALATNDRRRISENLLFGGTRDKFHHSLSNYRDTFHHSRLKTQQNARQTKKKKINKLHYFRLTLDFLTTRRHLQSTRKRIIHLEKKFNIFKSEK